VNRQGLTEAEIPAVRELLGQNPRLRVAGVASHFADVEDTTDHGFARRQMERFHAHRAALTDLLEPDALVHMTCSAATLLWPEIHGGMARVGVAAYGIWPSRETLVSFRESGRGPVDLRPAMTLKVRISQVRRVPAGETVGYGRSWKAMTDSTIAVLPVGYSDGLPRALGGRAHVLVGGYRAPLVGRICMNLCMADVSNIPGVRAGDPAVFLGRQGAEVITAEMLADHLGTIPYEILTLPGPTWHRVEKN
jgi:alanine racemase